MKRQIYTNDNKLIAELELPFFPEEVRIARNLRNDICKLYENMIHEISVAEDKYADEVMKRIDKFYEKNTTLPLS